MKRIESDETMRERFARLEYKRNGMVEDVTNEDARILNSPMVVFEDQEVKKQIDGIRSRGRPKLLEELKEETQERVTEALEVMGNMVPKALGCINDILSKGDVMAGDRTRLQAAQIVLGVFGISEKKKLEVTRKEVGNGEESGVLNELKREFRRHIEKVKSEGAVAVLNGVKEGEVPE